MQGLPFTVQWPGKLIFEPGRLAVLGDEVKVLGSHAFVATTRDLAALGLAEQAGQLLRAAGVTVTLYEEVEPDPTSVVADEAAAIARERGCDVAIGLGGCPLRTTVACRPPRNTWQIDRWSYGNNEQANAVRKT